MFLRDNELARGGRRGDRARVLQLAREQREARGRRKEQETATRQLQAFARGRLASRRLRTHTRAEFDQKLGDIAKLKVILQLPNMPLPYDALFELLHLVLSFYTESGDDAESERVNLFQRLVKADKDIHQNESCSVYRIRIHRGAILEDGLKKLNSIRTNLKKRINVVFVNSAGREEVGIDAGGLFKEFWLDLSTLAFDLQYGLFLTTHDQLLYPNPNSASGHFSRESDHLTMFQFVGRILGKALYEGIVVQPKFAHFFLSKLLHSFNQLNELPSLDPEIYKNLMFLKSYDGDVEDLGLTHTVVQEVFGEQKEIEIIPGGGNVPVTNRNKTRYIHLVANYYLNTQIREQCAAFQMGLSDLIDPRWLQMFNEPELQVLISGKSGKIDVDDLKANSRYAGGYYALDKRVAWLWQALSSFTPSEQATFLRFTTSCQRAPSLGFASLTPQFCVQKIPIRSDDELLPSSSTCFNTLKLPTYSSYKVLRAKLLTSISSGAGFEMT
ncbi:hypothetical protein JG687_00018047 [Phytophthora cactorum]|uniref:HECT-type E3 ubiquitin transferase n=1 Tax=Phytophthora cactorum TaxID=29920 RepID=A0A8T1TNZ2_9STRA|nr:hypothetical protein JG687_00018047 [Phytophthora cactorum]